MKDLNGCNSNKEFSSHDSLRATLCHRVLNRRVAMELQELQDFFKDCGHIVEVKRVDAPSTSSDRVCQRISAGTTKSISQYV